MVIRSQAVKVLRANPFSPADLNWYSVDPDGTARKLFCF